MNATNRVLVIDDDPMNLDIVEEILSEQFQVKLAGTGEEALEVLSGFKPDLVLLDIMMPGIDGYEVCKKIRNNPDLRFTKVLMVSAKAMVDDRLTGYQIGADDYIVKPFNDEELLAKVKVYLKLRFLEELEELRKNTLKSISQNIREPLISMFSSYPMSIDKKSLDTEMVKQHLMEMQENGRKLMEYCNKTLLLCELKDGRDLQFEDLNIADLMEKVISDFNSEIKHKEIKVSLKDEFKQKARIDKSLMENALKLVLQNSIRYSPKNSKINIHIKKENDKCQLSVEDEGTPLLQRVFNELSREEINIDGVGEGIAISVAEVIAKLHGGKLTYKRSSHEGVRFDLTI